MGRSSRRSGPRSRGPACTRRRRRPSRTGGTAASRRCFARSTSKDRSGPRGSRRKTLMELQQAQTQAAAEQQYREQVQAQRQTILRQILTPEARERLGRIELAYPELKENIENQLIQLAQSGRVQRQIDDATLRQILERVIPRRRDIKIERR